MEKLTVMVTGVGGGGHGEQILKALRMGRIKYTIVGGDMSPYSKGLFDVDHPYVLPPASSPDYVKALVHLCKKHDVKVLFHGSEPELRVMSRERKLFADMGVFLPINPQQVIDTCMDKVKTMRFLKDNGFSFPRFVRVGNEEDLANVSYIPAVLKPSIGAGGSANTFVVQSREELMMFGRYMLSLYPEFIAQEYVGVVDEEYTVGVLIDMDGGLLNSIAVRKKIMSGLSNRFKAPNRTGDPRFGEYLAISSGISQGEIGPYPEVTGPCEKIALALGCRGAVNIQCRWFEGKVYVFEINPRFSGTTSLRALAGYNEPDSLIRKHIFGHAVEKRFAYQTGVIVRGLNELFIDQSRAIPHALQ